MSTNKSLSVRIITPKEVLFEGAAYAVSSTNSEGKFDILPEHANFITLIDKKPIEVTLMDQKKLTFNISEAIIYCFEDKVTVFAEPHQK